MKPAPPVTRTRSATAEAEVGEAGASGLERVLEQSPGIEHDARRAHHLRECGDIERRVARVIDEEDQRVCVLGALLERHEGDTQLGGPGWAGQEVVPYDGAHLGLEAGDDRTGR